MTKRSIICVILCVFIAVLLQGGIASAKIARDINDNLPVAIVGTNFDNVEIQLPNKEWRKCYLLDLLPPQTKFRVNKGGKLSIIYFFDDHTEVAREGAEGTVSFNTISPYTGNVDKLKPKSLTPDTVDIPYILFVKLRKDMYKQVNDPGEEDKEKMFLSAWVKNWTFPPVFYWYNVNNPPYRVQLFNENDEFLYEKEAMTPTFKYPYSDPELTKGTKLYFWQVLTPSSDVIVRKYPFKVLTLYQARDVLRREKEFEFLKAKNNGKFDSLAYTEMFLLYVKYTCWDKLLHLCDDIKGYDQKNPVVCDLLARLYLLKGCPIYSLKSHEQAKQLGSTDDIVD